MESLRDIDKFEPNVVNRSLRRWPVSEACERLLLALQQKIDFPVHLVSPHWETGTWPLSYYHKHYFPGTTERGANERVLEMLGADRSVLNNQLVMKHVESLRSSQADILVSDDQGKWFFIIEVKVQGSKGFEYKPSRKSLQKLGITSIKEHQAHQLVHLDVAGKLLARLTGKRFALASMGANRGSDNCVDLNHTERALYQLIGEGHAEKLRVVDLTWESIESLER
jgi:hypothetical protein